jgi:hypothetical protein
MTTATESRVRTPVFICLRCCCEKASAAAFLIGRILHMAVLLFVCVTPALAIQLVSIWQSRCLEVDPPRLLVHQFHVMLRMMCFAHKEARALCETRSGFPHIFFVIVASCAEFEDIGMSGEAIIAKYAEQGELVRTLKTQKAPKAEIDAAVGALLLLKNEYKQVRVYCFSQAPAYDSFSV